LNLPRELINTQLYDLYDSPLPFELAFKDTCDEELEGSKFKLDNNFVDSFQGWTKNYIILLVHGENGDFLARFDRNPPVGS